MKKIILFLVAFLACPLFSMVANEKSFLTCEVDNQNGSITRWCMLPCSAQLTMEQLREVKDLTETALKKNEKLGLNDIRRKFPDTSFLFTLNITRGDTWREDNNPLPSWNEYPMNVYQE
jgi:hypothetical protein